MDDSCKGGNAAVIGFISVLSHLDNTPINDFIFTAVAKLQRVVIAGKSRSGVEHEVVIVKVRESL